MLVAWTNFTPCSSLGAPVWSQYLYITNILCPCYHNHSPTHPTPLPCLKHGLCSVLVPSEALGMNWPSWSLGWPTSGPNKEDHVNVNTVTNANKTSCAMSSTLSTAQAQQAKACSTVTPNTRKFAMSWYWVKCAKEQIKKFYNSVKKMAQLICKVIRSFVHLTCPPTKTLLVSPKWNLSLRASKVRKKAKKSVHFDQQKERKWRLRSNRAEVAEFYLNATEKKQLSVIWIQREGKK